VGKGANGLTSVKFSQACKRYNGATSPLRGETLSSAKYTDDVLKDAHSSSSILNARNLSSALAERGDCFGNHVVNDLLRRQNFGDRRGDLAHQQGHFRQLAVFDVAEHDANEQKSILIAYEQSTLGALRT